VAVTKVLHGGSPSEKCNNCRQPTERPQDFIYIDSSIPYMHRAGGHRLEALRLDSTWRLTPDFVVRMTCAG